MKILNWCEIDYKYDITDVAAEKTIRDFIYTIKVLYTFKDYPDLSINPL